MMANTLGVGLKTLTPEQVKDSSALERCGIIEIIAVHGLRGHREKSWGLAQQKNVSKPVPRTGGPSREESRERARPWYLERDVGETNVRIEKSTERWDQPYEAERYMRETEYYDREGPAPIVIRARDSRYEVEHDRDRRSRSGSRSRSRDPRNSKGLRRTEDIRSGSSTERNVIWLRDDLPTYVPHARVSSFGYELDGEGISTAKLGEKAKELLDALTKQEEEHRRTFVFVGHNLGGLIIKQALIIANAESAYSDIAKGTSLLLFFGTPQRAENQAGWERLAYNLIHATGLKHHSPLSDILKKSSFVLKDVNEKYASLGRTYSMLSFCEKLPLPSLGDLVIDRDAATTGVPNETVITLSANHLDMCRLISDSDEVFSTICDRLMTASAPEPKYIEALQHYCLLDITTHIPKSTVLSSLEPRWILEDETFIKFIKKTEPADDSAGIKLPGVLQLAGQAGSGLSVLLTFLSTFIKQLTKPLDAISAKVFDQVPEKATVVTFSFDSRDYRTRSTSALFTSLTRQLLGADPANFRYIQYMYDLLISREDRLTLEHLWILFRSVILSPSVSPVYCFVDAVNKCDPERNHFLGEFLRLPESTDGILKIFITNNDGDVDKIKSNLTIKVDERECGKTDLEGYVDHEISKLIEMRPSFHESAGIIREKVLALEPTFLITMLVFKHLHDIESRSTPFGIQTALNNIPQSLADIYKQGYLKTSPSSSHWTLKAIYWIAHSLRPLKVEELATALAIEYNDGAFAIIEGDRPRRLAEDLKRTFGSFLTLNNDEVSLVHESARDFLLQSSKEGDSKIMGQMQSGHAGIANVCLDYLLNARWEKLAPDTSDEVLKKLSPPTGTSSLFPYAAGYWYFHCRLAGENNTLLEKVRLFLGNEDRRTLWSRAEWYEGNGLTSPRNVSEPSVVAAQLGLNDVLLCMVGEHPSNDVLKSTIPEIVAGRGDKPLLIKLKEKGVHTGESLALPHASQNGHLDVVKFLLQNDANIDVTGDGDGAAEALSLASQNGYLDVVVELLGKDVNVNVQFEERSPLHYAADFGSTEICRKLIQKGAEVNAYDEEGSTPLYLATKSGHLETMRLLIDSGADVSSGDDDTLQPLHIAAKSGLAEAVKLLISKDAPLNAVTSSEKTALHFAVEDGYVDCIQELLVADANVNLKADDVGAPLNVAATRGSLEIAKLLLEAGAEIDSDDGNNTPLHLAARSGHTSVVKLLLDHDADMDSLNYYNQTALNLAISNGNFGTVKVLLAHGAHLNSPSDDSYTPVVEAAKRGDLRTLRALIDAQGELLSPGQYDLGFQEAAAGGHEDVMKELIYLGASPDGESGAGTTPLHSAVKSGNIRVVQLLLDAGANVDSVEMEKERTPLLDAAASGHPDIVTLLLAKNADATFMDTENSTFLHCAVHGGNLDVLNLALTNNAGILEADQDGLIPLHIAAEGGFVTIARRLLDFERASDQVKALTSRDRTPLHLAAKSGSLDTAKLLLANNAEVETSDATGYTALHLATKKEHLELVKFFVEERGANVNKTDTKGRTPLFIAFEKGNQELVDFLLPKTENLKAADSEKNTILHMASTKGMLDTVNYLLEKGLDVNIVGSGDRTPVSLAAENGSVAMVQIMIEADADLNILDVDKKSPLTWAIRSSDEELTKIILAAGAKPDLEGCLWSPVYSAAYYGRLELVQLFVKKGFDIEKQGPNHWTPLHACFDNADITGILIDAGAKTDLVTDNEETSLELAIRFGYPETMQEYLKRGIDPLQKNVSTGSTAVHMAAGRGNMDMLSILLEHVEGKDLDIEDNSGSTPLERAVTSSEVGTSTALLDGRMCNVNRKNSKGNNLLELAMGSSTEMIELLIEKGATIEPPSLGEKLMRVAAEKGSTSLARTLIDRGVDSNKVDEHGWTPEMVAKVANHGEVASMLKIAKGNAKGPSDLKQPSKWSAATSSEAADLDEDKLTATRTGTQRIASIFADHPVSILDNTFYFEIEVLNGGESDIVGIGLATEDMGCFRMPGWDKISWGYHGDNGEKYHDDGWGFEYTDKRYGKGDTIGCFFDIAKKELSYYKNGESLGVAFGDVYGRLFPVVGLGQESSVRANFGKTPFKFGEPGKEKENADQGRRRTLNRTRTRDFD